MMAKPIAYGTNNAPGAVYLMKQGRLDEAILWLGKVKQARRYEPRQFPFMNLGRVYLKQGRWWDALQ